MKDTFVCVCVCMCVRKVNIIWKDIYYEYFYKW